jgi:YVTN family beta-propeller protein
MNMKAIHILITVLLLTAAPAAYGAQLLVLNKSDSTLSFIEPVSGKTTATIPTGEGPHEIELSSDGKLAFVSNYGASRAGNTLSVIDVEKRTELERVDLKDLRRPHGLSVSKGFVYFTAEDSRRVGRYDPKAQDVDWTFDTTQERTHMILASRDESKLFTSNMGSNSIGVLEQTADETWRQTLVFVGKGPEALDESPDGRELWTAHSADGGISIIDPTDKKVIHSFDAKTQRSNRLKFTPDGRYVLVSDLSGGELLVIDAVRRKERARIKVGRTPTGILIEPSGRHAYVAVSGENRIGVLDLKTMTLIKTIATGNSPDGMAWVR